MTAKTRHLSALGILVVLKQEMGKKCFSHGFSVNSCSAGGIWSWRAYWILLLFLANDSQQTLRNQSPLISSLCLEGDQQAQRNWSQSKAFYLNAQSLVVFGILRRTHTMWAGPYYRHKTMSNQNSMILWHQHSLLNTSQSPRTPEASARMASLISRPWHRPTHLHLQGRAFTQSP